MSRVVRYMPPVENMSGKFDQESKKAKNGSKLFLGVNHLNRHAGNIHQGFATIVNSEMHYLSADTATSAAATQAKFRRVVAAAKARKKDMEYQAQDQIAFRNQKKYGTFWGFLFATCWALDND